MDSKKLLEITKAKLRSVVEKLIDSETEPEKIEQYRKARRNYFYWNGIFNLAPTRVSDQIVDYAPIGIPVSSDKRANQELNYNFNIIRGDFIKAIAHIGDKAPDCTGVADEADDETAIDMARRAEVVDKKICGSLGLNQLQAQLLLDLSLTSTTFIYGPWLADGDRFGYSEEPVLEAEQVPFGQDAYKCVFCGTETPAEEGDATMVCSNPECSKPLTQEDKQPASQVTMPSEKGTQRFPNGGVEYKIRNIFTCSAPFFAESLRDAEWFKDEEDITPSKVMEIFPDISKEIIEKGGTGAGSSESYGTNVRQQISSESGIRRQRSNTVRFARYWLRSSFLNNLREDEVPAEEGADQNSEKKQTMADLLKENFPRGLRVTFVNGEPVDLFEESIDDVWTECKPTVSKYLFCDPLCHDTIPTQELLNRTGNIGVATLLRAMPVTLLDSELIDRETWNSREPVAAEYLPVKRRTGMRLEDSVAQMPMARFSDQQMPFMQGVRDMSRDNNGIRPELFGGGPTVQTAREATIRKQSAAMQLRLTYINTATAWAEAREKGVRQYARYAPGQIKGAPSQGILGVEAGKIVDIADLADGKFHFEPDSAMPRTFEDEREYYRELVSGANAAPPALLTAAGLDSPVNLPRVQKFFGMAGAYYPGKDERRKLGTTIQRLLSGEQIQLDPWDDAALMAKLAAAWLNSEAGTQVAESNPEGFKAVVAYWQSANQASAPPKPPAKGAVSVNVDKLAATLGADAAIQAMDSVGIHVDPPPQPDPQQAQAQPMPPAPAPQQDTAPTA